MNQTEQHWIEKMNDLGNQRQPFLFIISFDKTKAYIFKENEIPGDISVKIGKLEKGENLPNEKKLDFDKYPIEFDHYQRAFDQVKDKIHKGYSYLTNLTFSTGITTNFDLAELFTIAHAKYKLYIPDHFVLFSPECFVKINDNVISTYPMKGTIDASLEDAEKILLADEKETAEHYTIVDLLRNDLSMVAKNVRVKRFRYLEKIITNKSEILQTSSEIEGNLLPKFRYNLGNLFDLLLPAGSISGAPKKATINIIENAEKEKRNFYTGVFGYFDGQNLDSAVMIRFIEKVNDAYFFKSGGGITSMSDVFAEYKEMIEKVYVPIS